MYNSELRQLFDLTPITKYFEEKIQLQFSNSVLVVEQNNYASKILNSYIIYELDNWQRKPLNNFTFKNFLFGATNTVKNREKSKYDLSDRVCVPNKTTDINSNVFDMITRINESKALTKHKLCECKCKFGSRKWNQIKNEIMINVDVSKKSEKTCIWI